MVSKGVYFINKKISTSKVVFLLIQIYKIVSKLVSELTTKI